MNNDYIYRSFTKDELVQRCIDLGINRVAMLAERSRLRAELAELRAERDAFRSDFETSERLLASTISDRDQAIEYSKQWREKTSAALAERDQLRAELDRLRAALEEVAAHDDQHRETCRAALREGGSDGNAI